MDKVISDYHIAEMARDLKDWGEIAPSIGLSEGERKEIKKDFQEQYNRQKRQALHVWYDKCGDHATYRVLLSIFRSQGLTELAELVEKMAYTKKQSPLSGEAIDKFHSYLLECYCDPPMQHLSTLELQFQHQYTELAFRQVPIANIQGNEKSTDSRRVKLSTVLDSESRELMVLFEGVGGSGKTALSSYICRKWAEKMLLQQFHLLIHIQLTYPQILSAKQLSDLISYLEKKVCQEVATAIYDQKGEGFCILLDGLDEASIGLLDTIFDMIRGRQRSRTPKLSYIMTTRLNMRISSFLQPVLKFKIILEGFGTAGLQQFFESALDHEQYLTLKDKFEANPQLKCVCAHPINAVIIAFLTHVFEDNLPVTQTGIYKALVNYFLDRHIQVRTAGFLEVTVDSFESLPPDLRQSFKQLCEWAYKAFLSKKHFFTAKELGEANVEIDNTLGFLQIHPNITMYGTEHHYSFTHTSIQEFIAAVHVSLQPDKCHAKLVKQLLKTDLLNHVVPFYAGLTGLSNAEVISQLSEVLKHPLHGPNTLAALRADSAESNDPRRKTLVLFNCLYESQNESLLKRPEMQLPECWEMAGNINALNKIGIKPLVDNVHIVSFLGLGLTPSDCVAIAYFMRMNTLFVKDKSVIMFEMGICSDSGMTLFMKELRNGVNTKTPTQLIVKITYNALGKDSLFAFKDLLRGQSNISALHITSGISSENIGIALKSIVEGLGGDSSCVAISLSNIAIGNIHAHYLALLLRVSSLSSLMISYGDLQNHKTMHLFSEAIKLSTLKSLNLSDCWIDDVGLHLLGQAISANMHLSGLTIPGNPITVNGMMNFLALFIDTLSPFLGVIIDDELFHMLQKLLEYQILIRMLNYVRQKQGRMGFIIIPFNYAFDMTAADKPIVYKPDDARSLFSRIDAV